MGGKGSNTSTTQSSSAPDSQAAGLYRDILNRAQGVASTPYQSYSGELTAPVNAQQTSGINNINQNAGFATPYIQQAAGMVSNAANPLTAEQIQQYQNPYTQQVVDATQASFAKQNAQQQAGLTGNSIAQGALGGNRVGVAQANLAGQQSAAQAPVIAGLYNQGYNQAVQTAGQQFQQNPMNAAYGLGNLGVSGQTAALSGAGAQLGAGTLQQQTQQAANTANYGQFTQQQAYPYQQLQWLAGLGTGVGSQLGGTSSGSSTAPAPNQTAQWAGLGLSAASLFMKDGGRVAGFADGGVPGMPWAGAQGWIPTMQIHPGGGAPQAHAPGSPSNQAPSIDTSKVIGLANSLGKLSGPQYGGGSWWAGDAYGGSSSDPLAGLDASDYGPGYRHGGTVAGFAAGGSPGTDFLDISNGDPGWADPDVGAGYAMPQGFGPRHNVVNGDPSWANPDIGPGVGGFAERFGTLPPAERNPAFVASYMNGTGRDPRAYVDDVPLPRPRPEGAPTGPTMVAQSDDDEETAPPVAGVGSRGASPGAGVGPATVGDGGPTALGFAPETPSRRKPSFATDGIPGLLGFEAPSDSVRAGLLAAGLGMLASRSPNLGNAIGEGGIAGLNAYSGAETAKAESALKTRKIEMEAQKLATDAQRAAKDLELRTSSQKETARHNRATEDRAPAGYEATPEGGLRALPGGPADPEQIGRVAKAKATTSSMDEETADFLADRVLAGDTKALVGLGRGAQGAENLSKINGLVAKKAREGAPVSDAARHILGNAAQQAGYVNAERTQAAIMAKLSVYGRTAYNAMDLAERLSDSVPRTSFPPVNKILNAGRTNTGDPKIVALGQGLETLTNEYARAIGGGHGTVSDKEHARERLSAAQSQEQLRAVIGVMRQEILLAEHAMPAARQHIRDIYNPTSKGSTTTIEGNSAPPPTAADREIGRVYTTPRGPRRWIVGPNGQGWAEP